MPRCSAARSFNDSGINKIIPNAKLKAAFLHRVNA